MKKLFFAALVFSAFSGSAQEISSEKKTYIKANALFLPIGILNAGIETQLTPRYTLQTDIFISPWKSFSGHEAQIYMLGIEGRYYFSEAFRHWYMGANFSVARFIIQKWNYWESGNYQFKEGYPVLDKSNLYQDGFAFQIGATIGYQFQLSTRWNLDVYLGAGTSQDFYKGYDRTTKKRYDDDGRTWNRSGELIPYRGGVMISYQLK